jgi:hypothetical protein
MPLLILALSPGECLENSFSSPEETVLSNGYANCKYCQRVLTKKPREAKSVPGAHSFSKLCSTLLHFPRIAAS